VFIFLIAIVAFERLLMILKSIYILLFHEEYKFLPACIVGNLLGCDTSLGYDIDDEMGLWFSSEQF